MAALRAKAASSGDSSLRDGKSSAGCPAEAAANSRIYSLEELETMATVGKFTCRHIRGGRARISHSGQDFVILFERVKFQLDDINIIYVG